MKASVIKEMTTEEIKARVEAESSSLDKLKMNHAVSPLESPLVIRSTRRTVARLKTELNKRQK
ncbi:MAG: 50S ribosomal protein L29 [Flavobacteriales bacterium]|jgi:large subunit ribosomal protein L29